MKPRPFTAAAGLIAALCLIVPASAQVTFAFNYNDAVNTGFNDNTLGATRRGALESAAGMLASYFTGYSARTVTLDVTSITDSNSGTLASAGTSYFTPGNSFEKGLVATLIQTGNNQGQSVQGTVNWNFGHSWDYDDSIQGGFFDFKAVAIHELTHALGFASLITSTGASAFGDGTYAWFDKFLTNSTGNLVTGRLVNDSFTYVGGTILSDGVGSDVFFSGPNAKAAFGGNPVPIYSPATYLEGSSLSHLNTDYFTSAAYVMEHAVAAGAATRTLSAIELGILTDLGYNVAAPIPEPSTVALGFGLVVAGVVIVRRRRAAF